MPPYSRLCRLITLGKSRTEKGGFNIGWKDLTTYAEGLIAIAACSAIAPTWR